MGNHLNIGQHTPPPLLYTSQTQLILQTQYLDIDKNMYNFDYTNMYFTLNVYLPSCFFNTIPQKNNLEFCSVFPDTWKMYLVTYAFDIEPVNR